LPISECPPPAAGHVLSLPPSHTPTLFAHEAPNVRIPTAAVSIRNLRPFKLVSHPLSLGKTAFRVSETRFESPLAQRAPQVPRPRGSHMTYGSPARSPVGPAPASCI